MADQAIYSPMRVFDENGDPVPGALVHFFASGTTTLIDVYVDVDGSVLATNPVVADANGYLPQRYVSTAAKAVFTRPTGETLRTVDPVPLSPSVGSGAAQVSFAPTAQLPYSNVQDAIEALTAPVTEAAFGLMAPADKVKLNGIAAGATVDSGDTQANWDAGTVTTERLISPAKLWAWAKAKLLGVDQEWQDVKSSRSRLTTYQNTTGRPIVVSAYVGGASGTEFGATGEVSVNGSSWTVVSGSLLENDWAAISFVVPHNHYYRVRGNTGASNIQTWAELR